MIHSDKQISHRILNLLTVGTSTVTVIRSLHHYLHTHSFHIQEGFHIKLPCVLLPENEMAI